MWIIKTTLTCSHALPHRCHLLIIWFAFCVRLMVLSEIRELSQCTSNDGSRTSMLDISNPKKYLIRRVNQIKILLRRQTGLFCLIDIFLWSIISVSEPLWPRSLRWKKKLKHCSRWFVVREKHCSGWKKKPNKPDDKRSEQGRLVNSVSKPHCYVFCSEFLGPKISDYKVDLLTELICAYMRERKEK